MKKRMLAMILGGALAVGLFMETPAAVQVQAEEPEKTVSAAKNSCTNKTEAHITLGTVTAGDGQITVTFSINGLTKGEDGGEAWFCLSDKASAVSDDFDGWGQNPSNCVGPLHASDTSCTFTGLINGKTYYAYAYVQDRHGDENADDFGVHQILAIGSGTPVAGAGNTSSGSTSSASGTSSSGKGDSGESGYKAYENKVTSQIEKAQSGSTIVMEKGTTTLSNAMMQELLKKGDVSLRLEFTYNGEEYVIIIPAGAALDNDIPWYGPLYLAQQFGNSAKAKAAPASGGTYAVKSGDSLGKIAARNNMTLSELLAKNPQIKNADKISVGQNINL